MKNWCILVASLIFAGVFVAQAEAASRYKGRYSGSLTYKRATAVSGGTCYTQAQYPTFPLSISRVTQKGSKVTGVYDSAQGGIALAGKTNTKGFRLNFNYNDPYYGYRYAYKISFTSVTAKKATVTYDGITWSGTTGCHYTFSGKLTHRK